MKTKSKKLFYVVLFILVLIFTHLFISEGKTVVAATNYISFEEFAKALAEKVELSPVTGAQASGYVNALLEKGVIKEGDFTSYTEDLTREDAAVLLNRADEYLHGETLDPKLVQTALEKRISDMNKIEEEKRLDVVKCYLKGYITGYNNGTYSTNRELRGGNKITKSGALNCIKMLKDKTLRAKLSPDGQLIRTTKLPKYAKNYPYILASYPNSYYDWKFYYEGVVRTEFNRETRKFEEVPYIHITEYATPAEVDQTTRIENFPEVKKEKLDLWVKKVQTHMESIFNVDYRTIDQDWIDTMASVDYTYGYWGMEDQTRSWLAKYVTNMKKNKTIVESSKIAVDGSSLYYFNNQFYLRVYVKFRIVSSNEKYTDGKAYENNKLFYTSYPLYLKKYELGKWQECCFDVSLANYTDKEIDNLGVLIAIINDSYYKD
jgi:hypothetical protein